MFFKPFKMVNINVEIKDNELYRKLKILCIQKRKTLKVIVPEAIAEKVKREYKE